MLVFLSVYVILSILLSILVCAAAGVFCACVVSVKCSRRYRSWKRHSPSNHAKLEDIQKALAHNAWSHILFVHAITGFDTIPAQHNIGGGGGMFVLEDETERGDWIIKVIQQKDASHNEVASLIR